MVRRHTSNSVKYAQLTPSRMIKVCDKWTLEDFCTMEERDMEALLESYAPDVVPTLEQVRLGEDPDVWEFDGSFGWSI